MATRNGDLRLFVAVELPEPVLAALATASASLRARVRGAFRWVATDNMHLTLRFLGDTAGEHVAAAADALATAVVSHSPFDVTLDGLGVFPHERAPRVLWAGVGGAADRLRALQQDVEAALVAQGFAPSGQAFRPHLTLARINALLGPAERDALSRSLHETALPSASFRVEHVGLIRSQLRPEGPVHTRLTSAALRAR
ncbi:MAG: RNA 2',3'-cyclic phosphodiesterase [SAR202 cluster bacterium]|nr:RNA 2',3'-cyclic phosphodiesterase [SAR202 cluster bacterium]